MIEMLKRSVYSLPPNLADKIIDATDYVWLKLGLPDELFEEYNRLTIEFIDSKTWISPREFQQLLGTDVVRAIDPDAWVKYLMEQDGNFIVSDVRFANELVDYNVLLRRFDHSSCVVHGSEALALESMVLQDEGHGCGLVDYTLWNKGTIEELERNIRFMVTTMDFSNYK